MAYLKRVTIGSGTYCYIVKSIRRGDKVSPKVLEYLGRADKLDPKRLRRACEYWGVTKPGEGGKQR